MKRIVFYQKNKLSITSILVLPFIVLLGFIPNRTIGQTGNWTAPVSADKIKNPYSGSEKATIAGKKIYSQFCAICHGKKGKGDGMAGMALKPRPADFTKEALQKQTDGAIYWKLTEGKAPMAAYKDLLTEEQRWQLVNYIRSLK